MSRPGPDSPALVWFRRDLRLADNPSLDAAVQSGRPLVALYVLDEDGPHAPGGASRWWLHHSLAALSAALAQRGLPLTLRRGDPALLVPALVRETGATAIFWNRLYEPQAVARDRALKAGLRAEGCMVETFNGGLLHEPTQVTTGAGQPYKVFTPFWKSLRSRLGGQAPLPAPAALQAAPAPPGERLDQWALLPTRPDWAGGLRAAWQPGEAGAANLLRRFLDGGLAGYADRRDRPAIAGTSRLSPHLHFGEISPRQLWQATIPAAMQGGAIESGAEKFLSEVAWREFAHHLLFHFPRLPEENFRPEFDRFAWRPDPAALAAWQRGRTGYPIVDAGMRELWQTGWMHNRVRMITASFLVKHLLQDWRDGAAWFWDTLVDADLANNAASWQWVAGSGADAAPYFRIFNPVLQGEKFDPDGAYVRHFVPELADMPSAWIHKPWAAPASVLQGARVSLGMTYPAPIVDHAAARARALSAFAATRGAEAA
jgi:deoxyribodipyrimidine photo-lyase